MTPPPPGSGLTTAALAALLRDLCGDTDDGNWFGVPDLRPDPEAAACEACGWHALTPELVELINRVLPLLREAGAGSPTVIYVHCAADLFVDWYSADGERMVSLNWWPKKRGRVCDVHVAVPDPQSSGGRRNTFREWEAPA